MRNKILIICGPTATGKTSLGIKLAKKFNGEIISADSRQVYKGMDISTGKDLPKNPSFTKMNTELGLRDYKFDVGYYVFENVPVWLLDLAKPNQKFTVADYYDLAWKIIKKTWQKGKLPIFVGGTGFYLKAVTEGIDTLGIEPDWLLRKELQDFTVEEMQKMLKKVSLEKFKQMNSSDRQNPRRLMRALEVSLHYKRNKGESLPKIERPAVNKLTIGLKLASEELYKRIDKRINFQIKEGAIKELEELVKQGYDWNLPSMTAMGYGEWKNFYEGKKSEEETIKVWKFDEHGYARRQMIWFKKMAEAEWIDIGEKDWELKVEKKVNDWYS